MLLCIDSNNNFSECKLKNVVLKPLLMHFKGYYFLHRLLQHDQNKQEKQEDRGWVIRSFKCICGVAFEGNGAITLWRFIYVG